MVATKPALPPSRAIPRFISSLEVMYLTLESLRGREFELRNENWEICAEKSVASAPDFVTRNRKSAVLRILPGMFWNLLAGI